MLIIIYAIDTTKMKKYILLFYFPLITFGQISNQITIIGKAPQTNIFLTSQKDSKGNEYVVFVDFDEIDSTISIKLNKYGNNDNSIFGIKLKTFPYRKSNYTYNLCNAGIQIDSLENAYVFCSTPSLIQPDSSLLSDIDGYKIDRSGNKLWGSLGKNFSFQENNIYWSDAILEIQMLEDGSVHLFRLNDFFHNLTNFSYPSVVYYNIDKDGNKVFEKNIPNENVDGTFYYSNRNPVTYKVFKDKFNNLNLFHYWNITETQYKIHAYKYNTKGIISENYYTGVCDSLSNFDFVKFDDDIFFQKRQDGKTLYLKYTNTESIENNPTLSLDADIYSIIKKGNYYYYSILDSNYLAKYIQKIDLIGNKLYGEKGFEIRESAYHLNKAKYSLSLILLPKDDGSLMVLNSGRGDSLGITIGFISISHLNTPIIYPEQKVLKSCSSYLFEIPGNAYISSNTGFYNLYLEEGNSAELRKIKFNSTTIDYCNFTTIDCKNYLCIPISITKAVKN